MPKTGRSARWKKYWIIFKNKLQETFTYRVNFFAAFISEALSLLIMIYLWLSIYHQGSQIGSYSLGSLIIYFVLSKYINLTVKSYDAARYVGEMVRLGDFNNYLLKPLSFFGHTLSYHLGIVINNSIIFTLIFSPVFIFSNFHPSLLTIICFIVSLVIAFLVNFLFYYAIGISGLYFGYIMGFNFLMWGINSFFSGSLLPVDLFPKYITIINNFLPFKYIVYVPIAIITNKFSSNEILLNLSLGFLWSIVLYGIGFVVYKKGIKKYEGTSS